MIWTLKKWLQTIKMSWSFYLSYRINFVLQIIGPALVYFAIKVNLWKSIFQDSFETIINGYNLEQMIEYHTWALVVQLLSQGHTALNLSEEIRRGRISCYLIYPFQFWEFHTAQFIAFQCLQFMSTVVLIGLAITFGFIPEPSLSSLLFAICYSLTISVFWFTLQYMTGLMAFWLEETWILRVLLGILVNFLSGAFMPITFFPKWLIELINWTPLPYLCHYPIKFFSGELIPEFHHFLIIGLWAIPLILFNKFLWSRGMRMYTAAGM